MYWPTPPKYLDGPMSHRKLKNKVHKIIKLYYDKVLHPHINGGYNQMQYTEKIAKGIKQLFHEGLFLHGGLDKNVINCLQEYATGEFKHINFSGKVYAAMHDAILMLMEELDKDEYYSDVFEGMLKRIGKTGIMAEECYNLPTLHGSMETPRTYLIYVKLQGVMERYNW
ncbi:hypothetical protein BDZ94DRAFT_1375178 [Collybia nuda]|uniref:Uncharacterized protein n=1 Tax=Collybia nuda TaxID=64659 RepID=A0A9P5XPJ1_9AGAR|nr:hypothetical protein BDZ94DRAFT_1375178 [Collybia nuda]